MIQLPEIGGSYPVARAPRLEINCESIAASQFVRSHCHLFTNVMNKLTLAFFNYRDVASLVMLCKTSLRQYREKALIVQMATILDIDDEHQNVRSMSRLILLSWNEKTGKQQREYLSRIVAFGSLQAIKLLIPPIQDAFKMCNEQVQNRFSTIFGKVLGEAVNLNSNAIVQQIAASQLVANSALTFHLRRACKNGDVKLVSFLLEDSGIPLSDIRISLQSSLTRNDFLISSLLANFLIDNLVECYDSPWGPELLERVFTHDSITLDLRKISFLFWGCISDGKMLLALFLNRFFVLDSRDAVLHYARAMRFRNNVMMTFCLNFFSEIDLKRVWNLYRADGDSMEPACASLIISRFPTSSLFSASDYQKLFAICKLTEFVLKNTWIYYRSHGLATLERIAANEIIKRYPDSPHFSASDYEKLFDCFVHSD